jgi:guanylate kinase
VTRSAPFPLVIAAPSGAGKTSLARALVERHDDLSFALSATTRAPRPGERHDVDYHFVDEAGFDRLVREGALLEWAHVHGRRYGTLRRGVETCLAGGSSVVLDIDVQGARMVRDVLRAAVLVFVLPPSVAEMRRRIGGRGSGEDALELRRRLETARAELDEVHRFDYVVVNDDFGEALRSIESIIAAERCRIGRRGPELDAALAMLRADMDVLMERSS